MQLIMLYLLYVMTKKIQTTLKTHFFGQIRDLAYVGNGNRVILFVHA